MPSAALRAWTGDFHGGRTYSSGFRPVGKGGMGQPRARLSEAEPLPRALKGLPVSHISSLLFTVSLASHSLGHFLASEAWAN